MACDRLISTQKSQAKPYQRRTRQTFDNLEDILASHVFLAQVLTEISTFGHAVAKTFIEARHKEMPFSFSIQFSLAIPLRLVINEFPVWKMEAEFCCNLGKCQHPVEFEN